MDDKKMDISSLSDSQQQEQLHGLQEKFTEHLASRQQQQEHEQQQKQQQHEQYTHQQQQQIQHHSYDPSQVQAVQADDANHVYYYQQQQQHYGYNQSGFPNSYQQQMVHHKSVPVQHVQSVQPEQPVEVAVSQNGTSQAVKGSGGAVGEAQVQPQQNVCNPQILNAQQQRQVTAEALAAIAAKPGLDPNAAAAVSALAQLTQYAGTMGAAERATAAMQLQQLLGSGLGPMMDQFYSPNPLVGQPLIGGRGGRRGGGLFRGGNRGNGRGRGRGRGGKKSFSSDSSPSKASQPDPSTSDKVELSEQKEEPSVAEAETVPSASAPASVMIGPQPGPSQAIWCCDLCNADCNSAEILEQHKNGKKHKKNMQKTGVTISVNPDSQQEVDKVEQPADSAQPSEEKSIVGTKRKMTSGRGRKRLRTCEPPKPKVVIPVMCDLCNVKCDTQEVFDRHLAGKKHLSKVKRYEGHQAVYDPNVQALYPPNPIAQQPYYHPQVPQQPFYGTQSFYPPYDQYMPPQAHDPGAAAPTGYYHPQNNTTVGTLPFNM